MSFTTRTVGVIGSIALAAGMGLTGTTLADAAGPATGEVTADGGLAVRSAPSTHQGRTGALGEGQRISLSCKVRGTSVGGNNVWYKLGSRTKWVSARYVRNVGRAPGWCTDSKAVGKNNQAIGLFLRAGPTTRDRAVGSLAANGKVRLICKVKGEWVRGNKIWYQTSDRKWVTARYIDNIGEAPKYC